MNPNSFDSKISHKVPLLINVKKSNLTRSFVSPKFCSVLVIDKRDNPIQINNNYIIKNLSTKMLKRKLLIIP